MPGNTVRSILTFAAMLAFVHTAAPMAAAATTQEELNVVVIIVDTLGARHLGCYNKELKHSPNIDALAKTGVLFERAYSPAPWTKPAVASIFTGLMPTLHGARGLNGTMKAELTTMAELFSQRGFETAGFVSHTFIGPEAGYGQGFKRYAIVPFRGNIHDVVTSHKVTELAVEWLNKEILQDGGKKFLLFLHYFDPHYDYQHHQDFDMTSWYKGGLKPGLGIRALRKAIPSLTAQDIKYLIDLYHEEIAYTDYHIGKLIKFLGEKKLLNNTVVVLTADHGEEFMEHGWIGHTRTLYDELIHVPLIFSMPAHFKSARILDQVSSMDILPTLLAFSGAAQSTAETYSGRSLLPYLQGGSVKDSSRILLSEVDFKSSGIRAYKIGATHDYAKLILDKPTTRWELFDRKKDGTESKNVFDFQKSLKLPLSQSILSLEKEQTLRKPAKPESEPTRSAKEIEQLKSLGYM